MEKLQMRVRSLLAAVVGACTLGLAATAAQAAPSAGLLGAISHDAAAESQVENVTWYGRRHCHWHRGHRHCWYGHRYRRWHHHYGYYGSPYRYGYDYGYRRWW